MKNKKKKNWFLVMSTGNKKWQYSLFNGSVSIDDTVCSSRAEAERHIREAVAADYAEYDELSMTPDENYASTYFIVELHKVVHPVPRVTGVSVTMREQHLEVVDAEESEDE